MKTYVVSNSTEQTDLWHLKELPDPDVKPGEILIQVKAALRSLESAQHVGKIVIRVD